MMNDVSQLSLSLLLILISVILSSDGVIGEIGMGETESLSSDLGSDLCDVGISSFDGGGLSSCGLEMVDNGILHLC